MIIDLYIPASCFLSDHCSTSILANMVTDSLGNKSPLIGSPFGVQSCQQAMGKEYLSTAYL